MSIGIGLNSIGHVYEGASGQRRKVTRIIMSSSQVAYTVVKIGIAPENVPPVGTKRICLIGTFSLWAVRQVS